MLGESEFSPLISMIAWHRKKSIMPSENSLT